MRRGCVRCWSARLDHTGGRMPAASEPPTARRTRQPSRSPFGRQPSRSGPRKTGEMHVAFRHPGGALELRITCQLDYRTDESVWIYARPANIHANEQRSCLIGCINTTGADLTPALMVKSQSANSVCQTTTSFDSTPRRAAPRTPRRLGHRRSVLSTPDRG